MMPKSTTAKRLETSRIEIVRPNTCFQYLYDNSDPTLTRRIAIIDSNHGISKRIVQLSVFQYMVENPIYFLEKTFLRRETTRHQLLFRKPNMRPIFTTGRNRTQVRKISEYRGVSI